jgi:hypothetical protein
LPIALISERVENGACLQAGVGRIPNERLVKSVIHTELGRPAPRDSLDRRAGDVDGALDRRAIVERTVLRGCDDRLAASACVVGAVRVVTDARHGLQLGRCGGRVGRGFR